MLGVGATVLVTIALANVRIVGEPAAAASPRVNPAAANLYLAKVTPGDRKSVV